MVETIHSIITCISWSTVHYFVTWSWTFMDPLMQVSGFARAVGIWEQQWFPSGALLWRPAPRARGCDGLTARCYELRLRLITNTSVKPQRGTCPRSHRLLLPLHHPHPPHPHPHLQHHWCFRKCAWDYAPVMAPWCNPPNNQRTADPTDHLENAASVCVCVWVCVCVYAQY